MNVNWTDRLFLLASAAILFGLQAGPMMGQHGGPPSGGSPTGAPGAGSVGPAGSIPGTGTRGTTGLPGTGYGNGNYGTYSPNNSPYNTRPIFLTGKVMFDDGSPTNPNIRIERVCGGNVRLEAHTDGQGRFSFQIGGNSNPTVDADASDDTMGNMGQSPNGLPSSQVGGLADGRTGGMNPLWNCELRAQYPGYLSDSIDLANRRSLDDPNVGTIILRRAANVKGSTVSATTEEAPKKAQKNYQKGLQLAQKGQLEQAEKHFQQATDIYPKYAVAWFALGQVHEQLHDKADARKAYLLAASSDNKYVSPLNRLALLSAEENQWKDTADYSQRVIDLNPIEFPGSFWYNAVANFNLKKINEAQKSATALVKLDTQHRYPEAQRMLAQIALAKNDYPNAASHLREYLVLNPGAKDADALKQTLLKMDQASAETKKQ